MEWQQLIGFCLLVEHKNFTRAASASCRTQSALSQQVRRLEDEFGCRLINRISRKRFELTPAGERFYQYASSVVSGYERLSQDISEIKGLPRGVLRIAAPFTTLYHLFPDHFRTYIKAFPYVELTILDKPQARALELLKSGEIDIAVALESLVPKGLESEKWREVETFLMIPVGHPLSRARDISLADIGRYPFILPPRGKDSRQRNIIEERFEKKGIALRVIMEAGNVELSSRYVEAGIGISFATIAKGLDPLKGRRIRLIPMTKYFGRDHISLVCRKRAELPAYIREFLTRLKDP